MFRNVDGAGNGFGDTSISATTSDVARTSLYASTDSSNSGRVVVVALNKTAGPLTAGITLATPSSISSGSVYTLTAAAAAPVAGAPIQATAANAFLYAMPAMSVSVLIFKGAPGGGGDAGTPGMDAGSPGQDAGAPSFITGATVSSGVVTPGSTVTIKATFQNVGSSLSNGVADIEVYNSAGSKVGQGAFTGETIAQGSTLTLNYGWTAAAAGTYSVRLGVFGAGWSPDYAWNNGAATIQVVPSDPAQYSFESGTQGWTSSGGFIAGESSSTAKAYAGTHSLAVTFSGTSLSSQMAFVPSPPTPAGATVQMHLWCPSGNGLSGVQPFVLQGAGGGWAWTGSWVPGTSLTGGQWNTVSVQVPATAATPLYWLGIQFVRSQAVNETCYLDSVSW
jgi:hypothetical protein